MPYCPKCGSEYTEGFTECSDCQVPLVSEPPTNSIESKSLWKRWVELLIPNQAGEVDVTSRMKPLAWIAVATLGFAFIYYFSNSIYMLVSIQPWKGLPILTVVYAWFSDPELFSFDYLMFLILACNRSIYLLVRCNPDSRVPWPRFRVGLGTTNKARCLSTGC